MHGFKIVLKISIKIVKPFEIRLLFSKMEVRVKYRSM